MAAAREKLNAQYQTGPKILADADDADSEATCPRCGGLGVVRRNAAAQPGEADFGRVKRCPNSDFHTQARLKNLAKISNLSVAELEIRLADLTPYHQPKERRATKVLADDGQAVVMGSSNMDMIEVFGRLVRDPFCDTGMIFLLGEWGCGKTMAAMGLINEINLNNKGPAMYITLPDLIGFLIASYDDRNRDDEIFGDWSFERRYQTIARAKIIVVDEFDFEDCKVRDTAHNRQLLNRWFNERYRSAIYSQSLTVLISNSPIESMGLGAISSRAGDSRFRTIMNTAPDMRPEQEAAR